MPAERFHVRLLAEEGGHERVVVEVGLEGFNILDAAGSRALRKYPLHHISRWSMRGNSLVLFTRSPSDVEDQSLTLESDETTIRSVLDTLTCSCMQMAEMLQSGQGPEGAGRVAANSLKALLKKSKKHALLTADQVEFWHHPEKAGWMHSQGEHIKTWRKRWFVLKQGFLFRFAASDVGAASKPRGIVDLSTVTDVADGSAATGRPNSIKLSTATGHICYLCESETSQVEWYSALEGAVAKIIKLVAGVDEEQGEGGGSGGSGKVKSWAEELERTYASAGSASGSRLGGNSSGGGTARSQMVSIVNYETPGTGTGAAGETSALHSSSRGRNTDYVTVDYGSIAGANAMPEGGPVGGYSSSYAGVPEPAAAGAGYINYGQQPHQAEGQHPHQQAYVFSQDQAVGDYSMRRNLMDTVTAPQAAQQAPNGSPWKVHYTAEGRPYFYNVATGTTQWNAPT